MIRTEKPTKYDESVDANSTLDEYILSNYGGLPNESMLEEQWNALPDALEEKPVRVFWMIKNLSVANSICRFYLNRLTDAPDNSRTDRVLNGVVLPDGKVVVQWKKPHKSLGIYENLPQFMSFHVETQPESSEIVFID